MFFIDAIKNGYTVRYVSSEDKRLLDAIVVAYQAFRLAYYGKDKEAPNYGEEPNQEDAIGFF